MREYIVPESGMGANNDHGSSASSGINEQLGSESNNSSDSRRDSTTEQTLTSNVSFEEKLSGGQSHSSDRSTTAASSLPNEYAELFGELRHQTGGVDAVWENVDGTFSSSDGSEYDPTTGLGRYDAGNDSFANVSTSVGLNLNGQSVETMERQRHPERVRTSESLALVEHDPKGLTAHYGPNVAFDYYNNPNMDSIRDEALLQAAARANEPVSGRYPGENMAYIGVVPATVHLARSITLGRPSTSDLVSQLQPGTKITPKDIIFITRQQDASLPWLE